LGSFSSLVSYLQMPVSRVSIHRSISQDLAAIIRVLAAPDRALSSASSYQKDGLKSLIESYFSVSNVSLFPYARTAFYFILKALDLPAGSVVALTPLNIQPMLDIVRSLGLRPVFVDLDPYCFSVDLASLDLVIREHAPSCFLHAYLFGSAPNAEAISSVCKSNSVFLIEDISQAIGCKSGGNFLGSFGNAAIYSSSLSKFIDSYNGSFCWVRDDRLSSVVEAFSSALPSPSRVRVFRIITKSIFWRIALSRFIFSFFTYPVLFSLRTLRRPLFEKLLGPSVSSSSTDLPTFYFESLSSIQCQAMQSSIARLSFVVSRQKLVAGKILSAATLLGPKALRATAHLSDAAFRDSSVFWQFPLEVKSPVAVRDRLFSAGIETGATNLSNLAESEGVCCPVAERIKSSYLFVPMHSFMRVRDYRHLLDLLLN